TPPPAPDPQRAIFPGVPHVADLSESSRHKLRVLIFSASLRAGSLNTKLAHMAARIASDFGAEVDVATMREFDAPSFDGDVDARGEVPAGAKEFERRLTANDAFIIASPEYNGSMPGM